MSDADPGEATADAAQRMVHRQVRPANAVPGQRVAGGAGAAAALAEQSVGVEDLGHHRCRHDHAAEVDMVQADTPVLGKQERVDVANRPLEEREMGCLRPARKSRVERGDDGWVVAGRGGDEAGPRPGSNRLRQDERVESRISLHLEAPAAEGDDPAALERRRLVPDHQWRKWRRPVKTIAMWCRSATSIAISSLIEPPGWMMAVTPRSAASWIASANGK